MYNYIKFCRNDTHNIIYRCIMLDSLMYMFMYVYVYMYMYMYMYVYVYVYIHVCTCMCMRVYIYTYVHVCEDTLVQVFVLLLPAITPAYVASFPTHTVLYTWHHAGTMHKLPMVLGYTSLHLCTLSLLFPQKGLYQKAEALYSMGDFEHALMFYHRGHKIRPELHEFTLGVQKAQEAINNNIGGEWYVCVCVCVYVRVCVCVCVCILPRNAKVFGMSVHVNMYMLLVCIAWSPLQRLLISLAWLSDSVPLVALGPEVCTLEKIGDLSFFQQEDALVSSRAHDFLEMYI